jgi:glycerol-3-phosphate cytidylyltransferase-like family protein
MYVLINEYNLFLSKYRMNDTLFLLEDTVGEQAKRAVVIIGRFNPPHIGHYAVINAAKKYIRNNPTLKLDPVPIVVVIEGKKASKDKMRNPLTGTERISFMSGSGLADGVKFLKAESAFAAFEEVRKCGYEPIVIADGSDRDGKFKELLDKYFKSKDNSDIKHYSLTVKRVDDTPSKSSQSLDKKDALDNVLQYTDSEMPAEMASASLARHAVTKKEPGKFAIITGLTSKPKLSAMMFNKIKAAQASGGE